MIGVNRQVSVRVGKPSIERGMVEQDERNVTSIPSFPDPFYKDFSRLPPYLYDKSSRTVLPLISKRFFETFGVFNVCE